MAIQVNFNQFPIIINESLSGKDIPKSSKSPPDNAELFLHPLLNSHLKTPSCGRGWKMRLLKAEN